MRLVLFVNLIFSLAATAKVISHTENVAIQIVRAERALTCFTNDFDHSKGVASLSSSAVFHGAMLNSHQYEIILDEGADALCEKVKSIIEDADSIHPGTGKYLSGLVSSTLELEGDKIFEHVSVKVFLPKDPSRNLVFNSYSQHFLSPP